MGLKNKDPRSHSAELTVCNKIQGIRSTHPCHPNPIFCLRVAAVVRRLASCVTTAATSKSEPFDELTVCDKLRGIRPNENKKPAFV